MAASGPAAAGRARTAVPAADICRTRPAHWHFVDALNPLQLRSASSQAPATDLSPLEPCPGEPCSRAGAPAASKASGNCGTATNRDSHSGGRQVPRTRPQRHTARCSPLPPPLPPPAAATRRQRSARAAFSAARPPQQAGRPHRRGSAAARSAAARRPARTQT